jgi:hypothetical protein
MIPIHDEKDPFVDILDTITSLTGDVAPETEERADMAREHDLTGLRVLGEDQGWELVAMAESMQWRTSTPVYRSALLYWIERREFKGKSVDFSAMDPGVVAMLMTLPSPWCGPESQDDGRAEFQRKLAYYTDHIDFISGVRNSRNPHHRKVSLSEDTGYRVSRLATTISQQSQGRFTAPEVLAMVGVPVLSGVVEENPVITEYPSEWVMSALGTTIEDELMHEMSRNTDPLVHRRFAALRQFAQDHIHQD